MRTAAAGNYLFDGGFKPVRFDGQYVTIKAVDDMFRGIADKGCRQAGYLLFFGGKIDPDPLRGTGFYEKGCDLGDVGACVAAGFVYATEDDGVPTDADKSRTYYSRGCDLGDDFACNRLGE